MGGRVGNEFSKNHIFFSGKYKVTMWKGNVSKFHTKVRHTL